MRRIIEYDIRTRDSTADYESNTRYENIWRPASTQRITRVWWGSQSGSHRLNNEMDAVVNGFLFYYASCIRFQIIMTPRQRSEGREEWSAQPPWSAVTWQEKNKAKEKKKKKKYTCLLFDNGDSTPTIRREGGMECTATLIGSYVTGKE